MDRKSIGQAIIILAAIATIIGTTIAIFKDVKQTPNPSINSPTTSSPTQTSGYSQTETVNTPASTPSPHPTPTPPVPRIYKADWSKGMNGWTASNDWHLVNGMLVNDGSQYNYDGNPTAIAPYPPDDITNYSVQAEIRLDRYTDEGGGVATFGIVARSPDGNGGYKFGSCAAAGLIVSCGGSGQPDFEVILSDGSFYYDTPVKEVPFRPDYAVWHTYRIDVQDNIVTGWIDGRRVFQVTNNKYLSAGQVGLWSDRCQISVRSFQITTL